jgi:hypothetical protein
VKASIMQRPVGPGTFELLLAGALALAAIRPAAADAIDPAVAKADALFAEGVRLRDSDASQACQRFGESLQLNPQAIGALLNVAICDEKFGRIASAVRRYRETRERAIEQRFPEYLKAAEAKLAELEPLVPYLTIAFDREPLPQTKIVVDDQVVPKAALAELPVDPGERVVIVSAPGRIPFQRRISIALRERRVIAVPPLERPSPRRTIGKISLATGAAAAATSAVLGYLAHRRYEAAINAMDEQGRPACEQVGAGLVCDGGAYARAMSAHQLGTVATIVGGAGVAVMLAGGYLWYFAPRPYVERAGQQAGPLGSMTRGRSGVSVVPRIGPDGGGVTVLGRF